MLSVDDRRSTRRLVPFSDIRVGDVFEWDGWIFMRVPDSFKVESFEGGVVLDCNALRIDMYEEHLFTPTEEVHPLRAQIVVLDSPPSLDATPLPEAPNIPPPPKRSRHR